MCVALENGVTTSVITLRGSFHRFQQTFRYIQWTTVAITVRKQDLGDPLPLAFPPFQHPHETLVTDVTGKHRLKVRRMLTHQTTLIHSE